MTINGETVWQSSTYYLPGPLKVIENPWMQYCVLLPKEVHGAHVSDFLSVNAEALKALGMETGLSHMEWFLKKDGQPVVSEVGARPPGVNIMPMMSLAYDLDMWDKWAELMVHDRWELPERKYAVGCAFLRAQGRGNTIVDVTGLEEAQQAVGEWVEMTKLPRKASLAQATTRAMALSSCAIPIPKRLCPHCEPSLQRCVCLPVRRFATIIVIGHQCRFVCYAIGVDIALVHHFDGSVSES